MSSTLRTVPCRSCGKPMIWARSAAGSNFPLDAEPAKDGEFAIVEVLDPKGAEHPPLAMYAKKRKEAKTLPLYKSHFATCPDAASWRKNRKGVDK